MPKFIASEPAEPSSASQDTSAADEADPPSTSHDTLPLDIALAPPVEEPLPVGRLAWHGQIVDDYQIVRFVASGGMGDVYEARDLLLMRRVAIKFLRLVDAAGAGGPNYKRLLDEARAGAALGHPGFVHIYKFGVWRDGLAHRPYLVMEWVPGQTLRHVMRIMPLPIERSLWLPRLRALLAAMAWAHERGLLHRDLKPENILITDRGDIKIIDLGLACLTEAARLSSIGAVGLRRSSPEQVGTHEYMAPEVWNAAVAGPAADVWSLGTILAEVLLGHHPYWRRSLPSQQNAELVCQGKASQRLARLAAASSAGLEPAMLTLLQTSLCKDPSGRYADAKALLSAFDDAVRPARAEVPRAVSSVPLPARISPTVMQALWRIAKGLLPLWRVLPMACLLAIATDVPLSTERPLLSPEDTVPLQGGTFRMGLNRTEVESVVQSCSGGEWGCKTHEVERSLGERWVTLSPFLLDRYEVTNREYAEWLNTLHGWVSIQRDAESIFVRKDDVLWAQIKPPHAGLEEHEGRFRAVAERARWPVTTVTWSGALAYCQARGASLPTEAEWEFAAAGFERRPYPWGDTLPGCDAVRFGRHAGAVCTQHPSVPAAVGTAPLDITPHGVHDLAGNVSEWVYDAFAEGHRPCSPPCVNPRVETDSSGMLGLQSRGVRGASYSNALYWGRSALRGRWQQYGPPQAFIGFRCARSLQN